MNTCTRCHLLCVHVCTQWCNSYVIVHSAHTPSSSLPPFPLLPPFAPQLGLFKLMLTNKEDRDGTGDRLTLGLQAACSTSTLKELNFSSKGGPEQALRLTLVSMEREGWAKRALMFMQLTREVSWVRRFGEDAWDLILHCCGWNRGQGHALRTRMSQSIISAKSKKHFQFNVRERAHRVVVEAQLRLRLYGCSCRSPDTYDLCC